MNTARTLHNIGKYVALYAVFIVLVVLNRMPSDQKFFLHFLPDFAELFVFSFAVWLEEENPYRVGINNIFILGLIVDVLHSLPIGLTGLGWLLSVKSLETLKQYFINSEDLVFFMRDLALFMIITYLSRYLTISYFNNILYPFLSIMREMSYNFVCFCAMYYVFIKTKTRSGY